MPQSQIEQRVSTLEETFQAFLQNQEERERQAEERWAAFLQSQEQRERQTEERWQKSWDESWAKFQKEANRIRGELAKKMGTIAEDLVAPSVPEILRQIAGCARDDVDLVGVRMTRRHPRDRGLTREIDVLATTDSLALVVEVRSRLRPPDVTETLGRLEDVREYFGDIIGERSILGAVASLYPDPSIVAHAERQGLIVLGLGQDLMDVKNSEGFEPKHF